MRKPARFKLLLCLLALLAACSSEQSEIRALLDARSQALQQMSIQNYAAVLANDYQDGQRDKAAVLAEMEALFQQFDAIQMQVHSQEVRILDDDTAQCEQSYTLKVKKDGVWRNVTRREQLLLHKAHDHWLIASGV